MSNTTTSTHKVIVTDGGTLQETTNKAEKLNAQLERTARTSKAASKAMERSGPAPESRMYDQARAGRGTGAEGRDFAQQAQGLGGLVRVYATFAANLFAVSAAFNALSRAADFTNMVKGLDQLGASSGRNLGTLSKQLVEITDGAVSMREAMTATAQTTAAGLGSKDVIKLAEGAKKASQALGLDMSDALNRLSRGVTKLEPELLDELGIFVRVDTAAREYARTLGKSATSLTDFEKRAAFANAVLTQLDKKFGAVELDANPYNKLLASLKNISTAGLELINKVLGPIASALANSPMALSTALAGIGAILLKQAIPALTSWRQGLAAAKDEAKRAAEETNAYYKAFKQGQLENDRSKEGSAYKSAAIDQASQLSLMEKTMDDVGHRTKAARALNELYKDPSVDASLKAKQATLSRILVVEKELKSTTISADRQAALNKELAGLRAKEAELVKLISLQKTLSAAETAYNDKTGASGFFSAERRHARELKKAEASARSRDIVSAAVEDTQFLGAFSAIPRALGSITNSKELSGIQKVFTGIKAGAGIAAAAIGNVMGAISGFLGWIGIAVTAIALLDTAFSNNAKQVQKFESSLDTLNSSFENIDRTIEVIRAKDPLEQLSVQSIQARANAFKDLSDSVGSFVSSFISMKDSQGVWDRLKDQMYSFFGKDSTADLAKGISTSISKAVSIASNSTELKTKLSKILNVNSFDTESITKALKSLDPSQQTAALKEFNKAMEDASTKANISASKLTTFKQGLETSTKSLQDLTNSLQLSDPLSKFGNTLLVTATNMQKLLDSAELTETGLKELLDSTEALATFSEDYAVELINLKAGFESNAEAVQRNKTAYDEARVALEKLQATKSFVATGPNGGRDTGVGGSLARQDQQEYNAQKDLILAARARTAEEDRQRAKNLDNYAKGREILSRGILDAMKRGADLIEQGLGNAQAKAAVTIARAGTVALTGSAALSAETKLSKEDTGIQLKAIDTTLNLTTSNQKLQATIERNNTLLQLQTERSKTGSERDEVKIKSLEDALSVSEGILKALSGGTKAIKAGFKAGFGKDVSNVDMQISQGLGAANSSIAGAEAQKTAVLSQQQALEIKNKYLIAQAKVQENEVNELNLKNKNNALAKDAIGLKEKIIGAQTSSTISEKYSLDLQTLQNNKKIEEDTLQQRINSLIVLENDNRLKSIRSELTQERVKAEKELRDARALSVGKEQNLVEEKRIALLLQQQQYKQKMLEIDLDILGTSAGAASEKSIGIKDEELSVLDIQKERSQISADEYTKKKAEISKAKELLMFEKGSREAAIEHLKNRTKLETDLKNANGDDEATTMAQRALELEDARYTARVNGERDVYDAKVRNIELLSQENAANELFRDNMLNINEAIADSLIEITQGVNREWSKMFEKMIMDAANAEIKLSLMDFGKSIMKDMGIGSFFGGKDGLFGGGGAGLVSKAMGFFGFAKGGSFNSGAQMFAHGGQFNNGIQMFAKGGGFTNSVVDSPTLFKFAKGTGMMGEAGPEAIMPLKRDAQGNLGVVNNNNDNSSSARTVNVSNNFTISGPVDKRTQQQIATAAAKGAQLALLRNG